MNLIEILKKIGSGYNQLPTTNIENMKSIIAFDIGASKIAYGLVELRVTRLPSLGAKATGGQASYVLREFNKIKTPRKKNEVIKKVIGIVEKIKKATFLNVAFGTKYKKIAGIGIGIAGQIDSKGGIVFSSLNMPGWKNVSLKKILEKELGLPVALSNDAHSFTIAEAKFGAAKGYHHIVGLTLGTGIGGGIIIDGKLYQGANNTAGEFGHTIVEAKYNFKCSCGFRKHLETFASGRAMENLYKKLSGKKLDTFKIEKRAIRGEKMALKVIIFSAKSLSIEMANIINFLNPEIIVIGGGLTRINLLWKPMIQETKKKVFFPPLAKTKIVKSKLDDKAGVLGAAVLAIQ